MRYKTVQRCAEAQYEINKSRFLTFVDRVDSEEKALELLGKIKKLHWEARHICSAYIIGKHGMCQRADDDGEPSGTAGKPILELLKKHELTDAIIVVTRYFGGIKLGAGGLIRAYGKAASMGIAAAAIVEKVLHLRFAIEFDYALLGALENNLNQKNYKIESKSFTDKVCIIVPVEAGKEALFLKDLTNWTASQCAITKLDACYLERPVNS